ncbi:Endoglucanase EG-II [Pseudocercospora fuligena]|uniref:Endoglucanase EG-II n=1 Tax=Pseudocercospora fuligena TaxID=685502 RepID=A0A8H6RJI4_9PEZI|nr:Endoglucanase EG-II [Pseudocercospora fuligena]
MKFSLLPLAAAAGSAAAGTVKYAGINIAGLDFGTSTDGSCTTTNAVDPGTTGISQMQHFVSNDGLNVFRLPVSWQYLLNNNLGGTLDSTNFGTYNRLVQGCLSSGAEMCIIDIHNYARWNGQIVGQGGPSNTDFASLWSQLATKYLHNPKVAFGIMNEPHDVEISTWATTVQEAVHAIRKTGCSWHTHKILLPGNDWTHATTFISDGSASALSNITNLDGTTNSLIFDVHAYLDSDGSGTSTSCSTDNSEAFSTLGDWLRTNKRKAFLTETGGGASDSSCLEKLCAQFDTLNEYSDVYLGWVGWAAGMFDSSYALTETPSGSAGAYTDQELVKQCIVGKFKNSTG